MSEEQKARPAVRVIPADEARHLPRWELGRFAATPTLASPRRPLSPEAQAARTQALQHVQQQEETEAHAQREAQRLAEEAAEQERQMREQAARRLQSLAYDEGYQAGYAQGIQQSRHDLDHLAEIARAWTEADASRERELAPRLVDLALLIARQVVARELVQDPALVAGVARQAVAQLGGSASQPVLTLHPQDLELIQAELGEELERSGWTLRADPTLSRGGCRLRSSDTDVDATLETRWRRTIATLGSAVAWKDTNDDDQH